MFLAGLFVLWRPELVLARSFWYSQLRCRYSNLAVTWLQSGQWLKAVEAGRHAIIWAGWVYSVDAAFLARHGVRMERVISQLALSVANLRRTAHSTGSSAGNLGDVQRFEHSPSVAVVTLCAYNASSSKLAQLSMSNKVRYCRIHSCTFVPFTERLDADRPIPWSKVLLVACQVLCVVFTMARADFGATGSVTQTGCRMGDVDGLRQFLYELYNIAQLDAGAPRGILCEQSRCLADRRWGNDKFWCVGRLCCRLVMPVSQTQVCRRHVSQE